MKLLTPLLFVPLVLQAQSSKVDVYSSQQLAQQEHAMAAKIDPATGNAQQILAHYPNHFSMLIVRDKDGQSELHETMADVFFVIDGSAELWTGGEMQNAKQTDKGEQRGSGLTGTDHVVLKKGDVVHIPARVPHQVRVAKGTTFTYFVVKVTETKE